MHVVQQVFASGDKLVFDNAALQATPQLVLIFGSRSLLERPDVFPAIRAAFPIALIAGCSTAGEIHDTEVSDETLVVTAIHFDRTPVKLAATRIETTADSQAAGAALVDMLPLEGLVHLLVFSDGLQVNGTDLVKGIKDRLPADVEVTGGLSADGANFQRTLVCANAMPEQGVIAAIGFYGAHIRVGYGSMGGWDPFGPERLITRSSGNILYDLDGQPALELYKRYLGEHAKNLPASGLLFPLMLRTDDSNGVVRTILAVNEEEQNMTFAGDMPEGRYARLMKANFERLIDGAIGAAKRCNQVLNDAPTPLALLISCVGRKLVLQQRIDEEIEGARDILGADTTLAGFYSYGEISPHSLGAKCELHNQTMTITTFFEA